MSEDDKTIWRIPINVLEDSKTKVGKTAYRGINCVKTIRERTK